MERIDAAPQGAGGLSGLTAPSMCFLASLGLLMLWGGSWHWEFVFSMALLLLPTAWFLHRNVASGVTTLDHLITSYALGFYPVFVAASGLGYIFWLMTAVFTLGLFLIVTGGHGVIYWLWMIEVPRWAAFTFTEEFVKALFMRLNRFRFARSGLSEDAASRAHVIASAAGALGYATAQSMFLMVLVTAVLEEDEGEEGGGDISQDEFVWMLVCSALFGMMIMPLNVLTSYLVSMEIAAPEHAGDTGQCCPFPSGFGFPPGGATGVRAFARTLKWPVALRTAGFVAFFIPADTVGIGMGQWFAALVIVVALETLVYRYTLRRVRAAEGATPYPGELLRSMYGFSLLDGHEPDGHGRGRDVEAARPPSAADDARADANGVTVDLAPVEGGPLAVATVVSAPPERGPLAVATASEGAGGAGDAGAAAGGATGNPLRPSMDEVDLDAEADGGSGAANGAASDEASL